MPHEGSALDLTEVEAMIGDAEAELEAVRRRLERQGRVPDPSDPSDPSDPADPVACLEIWLAALRAHRAGLSDRPG